MELPTTHTDPSGLFGSVITLIGAVLALVVAFGVELTEEQAAAILGVATAAGPLATAFLIRRHAWAPASHEAEIQLTRYMRPADDEDGQINLATIIWLLVAVILVIVIFQLI